MWLCDSIFPMTPNQSWSEDSLRPDVNTGLHGLRRGKNVPPALSHIYHSFQWQHSWPEAAGAFNFYAITILRPRAAHLMPGELSGNKRLDILLNPLPSWVYKVRHVNPIISDVTIFVKGQNISRLFNITEDLSKKWYSFGGYCVFSRPLTRHYQQRTKWR